jgi:hypothetical protein
MHLKKEGMIEGTVGLEEEVMRKDKEEASRLDPGLETSSVKIEKKGGLDQDALTQIGHLDLAQIDPGLIQIGQDLGIEKGQNLEIGGQEALKIGHLDLIEIELIDQREEDSTAILKERIDLLGLIETGLTDLLEKILVADRDSTENLILIDQGSTNLREEIQNLIGLQEEISIDLLGLIERTDLEKKEVLLGKDKILHLSL